MFKKCSIGRSHPYCGYVGGGKERGSETLVNSEAKELVDPHKGSDVTRVQIEGENSYEINEENKGKP